MVATTVHVNSTTHGDCVGLWRLVFTEVQDSCVFVKRARTYGSDCILRTVYDQRSVHLLLPEASIRWRILGEVPELPFQFSYSDIAFDYVAPPVVT